jgi:hypothetical protein
MLPQRQNTLVDLGYLRLDAFFNEVDQNFEVFAVHLVIVDHEVKPSAKSPERADGAIQFIELIGEVRVGFCGYYDGIHGHDGTPLIASTQWFRL